MIVWGGVNNFAGDFNTGGRYNPGTDTWATTSTANAPTARYSHTAVWTGSEMIIWGGHHVTSSFNTGGRYNPGTDSWTATSATNAPSGRYNHTAVWTGSEMIIWGGYDGTSSFNTGGRYNPGTDTWTNHQCNQRARWPILSHGSLEWQRNDYLGRHWEFRPF